MTKYAIQKEGEKAFEDGLSLEDCPYTEGSDEQIYWVDGYKYAEHQYVTSGE